MEEERGMQLIDGNGKFNLEGLKDFMTTTHFARCDLSYAIVAIIGPQSSGKSTLMNNLFGTNFREMDAYKGRGQTTKGVWIAKCSDIGPFTIAMDFEGTDSNQRGEDDTAFEKQTTLFALAIADIVLINMWYKDIGREHAASRPLLETVFQVMKRLFKPRKKTLMFVIRDHTKTPLKSLETTLMEDIEKIWAAVAGPDAHGSTPLSEFFNVEITALSSYEFEEDKFKEQVAQVRLQFFHSVAPGGLADDRCDAEPASGFSIRAEQMWRTIKDNKDLDFPALKVMVATVRCEQIAQEKLKHFTFDERWLSLEEAVQHGLVSSFGTKLGAILETYLSEYDKEVIYFDQDVRIAKRRQLESKASEVVHDAYDTLLDHLCSNTLESFKARLEQLLNEGREIVASVHLCAQSCILEFDHGCEDAGIKQSEWNASKVREKLNRDMLSELVAKYEKLLADVLAEKVDSLLVAGEADTWTSIRNLLQYKTEVAVSELSNVIVSFELHGSITDTKFQRLRDYARNVVERKARAAAASGALLIRMKDRFTWVFSRDENSKSRVWSREKNIDEIERNALIASLKILSIMVAIRLDEKPDNIENVLFCSFMGGNAAVPSSEDTNTGVIMYPFISNTWEGVPPNATLLSPEECNSLWLQFKAEIKNIVTQARTSQEARQKARTSVIRGMAAGVGIVVVAGGAAAAIAAAPAAAAAIATRPAVATGVKTLASGVITTLMMGVRRFP